MNRVIFPATGNAHKAAELRAMFASAKLPLTIGDVASIGGMPPVEETANTFEGNALLKARALRALCPKEAYVLADDSGLEVDALAGAPGVFSARYAGRNATDAQNLAKLLREMASVPSGKRGARFVCVLALIEPGGLEHLFEGRCPGHIISTPAGSGGFGYDPVFMPDGFDRTYADLDAKIKNTISHRARAMEKLVAHLRSR